MFAFKYGCECCGGYHNSEECDIPGVHDRRSEYANYVQNNYQGNLQRGGFQNRNACNFNSGFTTNANNFQNRYPRNNQQYPQRSRDDAPQQTKSVEEPSLSSIEKLLRDFMHQQKTTNDLVNATLENLEYHFEQGQRNIQAGINDLEKRLDRLSEKIVNRPMGTLPSFTQQNPRPIVPPEPSTSNQKYQSPGAKNEHINAISTRSGNIYGSNVNNAGNTDPVLQIPQPVNDDDEEDEIVDEEIEMEPKPIVKTPVVSTEPVLQELKPVYKLGNISLEDFLMEFLEPGDVLSIKIARESESVSLPLMNIDDDLDSHPHVKKLKPVTQHMPHLVDRTNAHCNFLLGKLILKGTYSYYHPHLNLSVGEDTQISGK